MSQKRRMEDEGAGSSTMPDMKRRRFTSLRSVIWEVMKLQSFQHLLGPALEPLIRKVVKEEVDLALRKHSNRVKRNCGEDIYPSESRSLKLRFTNNLSLPVFTGTRVEGEKCSSIKVELFDTVTGQLVTSGPESSAKVEIVVLEGDFDGDEEESWTLDEFKNNVVREREGKKALLTGDPFLYLKEGSGFVNEFSFTDNSSWTRSRKFRLGARIVDCFDGVRVIEAKTESFIVRDHRGELYKKHHPPALSDEVWRLEKIGKDGAFHKRLSRQHIFTVKDFLTLLSLDPPRLRHILGTGMSAKMWEVIVDHARTCILDKGVYLYCPLESQQKTGVVFNVVGQLRGLLTKSEYLPVDKLSETETVDAHYLVVSAYEHWGSVTCFDDEAVLTGGTSHLPNVPCSSSSHGLESSGVTKLLSSQNTGTSGCEPHISSAPDLESIYSIACESALNDYSLHEIAGMDIGYDPQTLGFEGGVADTLICDTLTESLAHAFCDDHLHFPQPDCFPQPQTPITVSQADLHSAVNGFLLSRSAAVAVAQKRWKKIFSILQWFYVRKRAALRRRNHVRELQRYSLEAVQEFI